MAKHTHLITRFKLESSVRDVAGPPTWCAPARALARPARAPVLERPRRDPVWSPHEELFARFGPDELPSAVALRAGQRSP